MNPPIGDCHKCGKPIHYGEGYYTIDLNAGAAAAGRGNYRNVHSGCQGDLIWFNAPPKVKGCACRFKQDDDFSPYTLIEECGFHASSRKAMEAAEKLLRDGGVVPINGEVWKSLRAALKMK